MTSKVTVQEVGRFEKLKFKTYLEIKKFNSKLLEKFHLTHQGRKPLPCGPIAPETLWHGEEPEWKPYLKLQVHRSQHVERFHDHYAAHLQAHLASKGPQLVRRAGMPPQSLSAHFLLQDSLVAVAVLGSQNQ